MASPETPSATESRPYSEWLNGSQIEPLVSGDLLASNGIRVVVSGRFWPTGKASGKYYPAHRTDEERPLIDGGSEFSVKVGIDYSKLMTADGATEYTDDVPVEIPRMRPDATRRGDIT